MELGVPNLDYHRRLGVKMKPILTWCETNNVILNQYKNKNCPKTVRCEKCKKKFKPFSRTCTGSYDIYCCINWFLPKHKKRIK